MVRREPDGRHWLRDRIIQCENCELHAAARGPVPFRGRIGSKVCIIGEAPGREEDARGGPFLGPAGRLLQQILRDNGVLPERLFYMNIVSCFPKMESKTPAQKHVQACRRNCWDQIAIAGSTYHLVVGNIALRYLFPWHAVGGDIRTITSMRGIPWGYRDKIWMACVHPAAALRQSRYVEMVRQDISKFVTMVRTGEPPWGEECYKCGKPVERYTEQGIAYCEAHLPPPIQGALPLAVPQPSDLS